MLKMNTLHNVLPHPALIAPKPQPEPPAAATRLLLSPDDTLANDNAEPRYYRIIDGCAASYHLLDENRRQITDILGPGRILVRLPKGQNAQVAKALTYSQVEMLDPSEASALAGQSMLEALERLSRHAVNLGRMNALEKIAHALIDLAAQFPRKTRNSRPSFTLYLTRADLADWLGLTVETVSRTLNQLKRAGIIDYVQAQVVTLLRPERLRDIAGGRPLLRMTSKQQGDTA